MVDRGIGLYDCYHRVTYKNMKNIKLYLIGFAVLFLITAVVTVNIQAKKIKAQKAEIERVQANNMQLMAENRRQTTLFLTEKEITGKLSHERDSLAKALKIRVKEITKIVYVDVITRDTIKVPVYVTIAGKDIWKIADAGECFKWSGNAFKTGDSLKVERTLFEYSNRTTEVYYKQRPFKFLFIRWGKWVYKADIKSECGNPVQKTINFIR